MWRPGCSLLSYALVVSAVVSCVATAPSEECKGPHTDSCSVSTQQLEALAEDSRPQTDETSLLHLSASVKKGGPKSQAVGEKKAASTKERSEVVASLPLPVFGSSLLQLKASSVSQTGHRSEEIKQFKAATDEILEEGQEAHMLAYVILFGIVIILLGLGLLVIVNMKKEEDAYTSMFEPPPDQTLPSATPMSSSKMSTDIGAGPSHAPGLSMPGVSGSAPAMPTSSVRNLPPSGPLAEALPAAIIPDNTKMMVRVPSLIHENSADHNHAIERTVESRDGTPMFRMKITRRVPNPHEVNHPEEYISFKLPEDEKTELVLCAFGRPQGKLECHIYQNGKDPWGIIKEDGDSGQYTMFLKNNQAELTAHVSGYGQDRRVRIHSPVKDKDMATAVTSGEQWYEVECYPNCDIMRSVVMITGVDRMTNLNARK